MGMFGELDNLSKQQQAASARQQTPASENAQKPIYSPLPARASSSAVTPKSSKPISKEPKTQTIWNERTSERAAPDDTIPESKRADNTPIVRSVVRTKIRHS